MSQSLVTSLIHPGILGNLDSPALAVKLGLD